MGALLGVDLNKIMDRGKTLGDIWNFYTINVKYLETLTHEQFCQEFPLAAQELQRITAMQNRLAELLAGAEGN